MSDKKDRPRSDSTVSNSSDISNFSNITVERDSTLDEIRKNRDLNTLVTNQSEQTSEFKKRKTTYSTFQNLIAGFSYDSFMEELEQKIATSPPSTPVTPFSPREDLYESKYPDINSPLLNQIPYSSSNEALVAKKIRPTTIIELRQLDIAEIEKLLTEVKEEAKHSRTPGAKAYLTFLLTLMLMAVVMELFFSNYYRTTVESTLINWATRGGKNIQTSLITNVSRICAWAFAVFNLICDQLSVNPIEQGFKLFNQRWGGFLEILKELKNKFGQAMFRHCHNAMFLVVAFFMGCGAISGLTDLVNTNNVSLKAFLALIVGLPGAVYFFMFALKQFEAHVDAKFSLILRTLRCLLSCLVPAYKISIKEERQLKIKKKKKASLKEIIELISTFLHMLHILSSNIMFKTLSATLPLIDVLYKTLELKKTSTTKKVLIACGAASLIVAADTRTLPTKNKFLIRNLNH